MNIIYMYLNTELIKADSVLVQNFADYDVVTINSNRIPLKNFLDSVKYSPNDEKFLLLSRTFVLGNSLDEFVTNGLKCIEKGLKVVFKYRYNLSFHQLINYKVFTTIEQQKAAFSSLYSVVMTDIFAHKNGRKRNSKEINSLRNYWLAYIYHNARAFKGALNSKQLVDCLHISTNTLASIKSEVKQMLENGQKEELEKMAFDELYSKEDSKEKSKENTKEETKKSLDCKLKTFKEKVVKILSNNNTQLDFFSSDEEDDI